MNTEIKVQISVSEDTDLDNVKPTDKIKVDIIHDNCGNKKLDDFADTLAKIFNYVVSSYEELLKEGIKSDPNIPAGPAIESSVQ